MNLHNRVTKLEHGGPIDPATLRWIVTMDQGRDDLDRPLLLESENGDETLHVGDPGETFEALHARLYPQGAVIDRTFDMLAMAADA